MQDSFGSCGAEGSSELVESEESNRPPASRLRRRQIDRANLRQQSSCQEFVRQVVLDVASQASGQAGRVVGTLLKQFFNDPLPECATAKRQQSCNSQTAFRVVTIRRKDDAFQLPRKSLDNR
ncbi:hypothetical protein D3C86_1908760 [compost metagenome]